ncbi:FCD domain-containing protein [Dongshaea marina]|uniref:FCD domain-containing protein n=1 Tax=Dongshaea marina TaxID=2047966 RepID=UPI000D3E4F48|nr:FCD domain-containing protein [Dongshaea marina]
MQQRTTQPKRLYQQIGLELYQELARGLYPVGSRLPPERDIAERFGVSRTVVREALIMLELEQLIEVRKGSGVYVLAEPSSGKVKRSDFDPGPFEMLQARQLLEANVSEFAAAQVTKNDINQMRELLERAKQALRDGVYQDAVDADGEFHILIAKATQNTVLEQLVRELWEMREDSRMWVRLHDHFEEKDYWHTIEEHELILQALQRKDPAKAKHAMWQHLENVKRNMMRFSNIEAPDFDGFLFNDSPVRLSDKS